MENGSNGEDEQKGKSTNRRKGWGYYQMYFVVDREMASPKEGRRDFIFLFLDGPRIAVVGCDRVSLNTYIPWHSHLLYVYSHLNELRTLRIWVVGAGANHQN